jgi:lipopolysaccharide/colanic/teichoic acid biosynthesis glycosyltransferase
MQFPHPALCGSTLITLAPTHRSSVRRMGPGQETTIDSATWRGVGYSPDLFRPPLTVVLCRLHRVEPRVERHWGEKLSTQPPVSDHRSKALPTHLRLVAPASRYQRSFKRAMDLIIASVLLVLLAPIMAVAALMIRTSIGSPVLFRQQRIGLHGRPFELYKLRTMRPERRVRDVPYGGPDRRRTHKSRNDPRVLPIGSLLRKFRVDELPQLWNVLKGDMSMVGPRPELPEIVSRYEHWQHRRHAVRPGLTGLWQVSSLNDRPMHKCTEVDVQYVESIGLRVDIEILVRTPLAILGRPGY